MVAAALRLKDQIQTQMILDIWDFMLLAPIVHENILVDSDLPIKIQEGFYVSIDTYA